MQMVYQTADRSFLIRDWQPIDRDAAYNLIASVLAEYELVQEPEAADRDVLQVEECYLKTGGEFWVVELDGKLVGTSAYYPIARGEKSVEIRKMYLLSEARNQGLGRFLLGKLEGAIASRGFKEIWIETASVLKEAVVLYEKNGYEPTTGVETERCDRVYVKTIR